ncbi:DUF3943 domain-containing protein [Mucilaginibacter terrenus]|uniref:DUF3943 domain-containing protein n=1 Tax=Mucilaginibacter terrenus TaxID=2482727 RepID=A0A3E2NVS9_9SPHI|nr:DUF3943 domain-containing protein [Mucilaginibacter terrenus]RFZ85123.1 DUF3943 domain-containing protein [Mucilaginibacter terrenus]
MMNKIIISCWIVISLLSLPIFAIAQQMPLYRPNRLDTTETSIIKTTAVKKNFGKAASSWALAEVLPWSFDRYVRNADYARISFSTIRHNLNPGSWTWDNDRFQTNQLGHPFHGSLFYNSFRANGYNFWQSALATAAGSYFWESTAENQAPAPNDFINTTFGGIVLGEMTHRLANKLINYHRRGLKRQLSETGATLINPMNGFSRMIDSKWGRETESNQEADSSKISVAFDLGARSFRVTATNQFPGRNTFGWYGRIKLLYGTPAEKFTEPFSNISITTEVGQDDSSKVNIVSVYGSITGWELEGSNRTRYLLILSANYDYIHNEAFFYGGQSVKLNLFTEYDLPGKVKLNTSFGAGPVILAAIPNRHPYNGRSYDYGPGIAINGAVKLDIDKLAFSALYKGGWMHSVNGNQSNYYLHTVAGELSFMLTEGFAVTSEGGYYALLGRYKDDNNTNKRYPYIKFAIRYTLTL